MNTFCQFHKIYNNEQNTAIENEFQRIKGQYYLEHAGATLYSEPQLTQVMQQLNHSLFANPHASKNTEDAIDIIRFQILKHFQTNSKEYSVIFTSGATAALKLVGESFNYNGGSLVYLQDNHTSVLGMRNLTQNNNSLSISDATKIFKNNGAETKKIETNSLFVFPAQSNFSGTKYPLAWIDKVQKGQLNSHYPHSKWFVLLDAASFCGTSDLNLTTTKPDFVTISFYKIFGYPTGLGALLVRNSSSFLLLKKYYGGGTVLMSQALINSVVMRQVVHERFEDGTVPYLSILALKSGFQTLERLKLDFKLIRDHTFALAQYVYRNLLCLHHSNGKAVAILYHQTTFIDSTDQGPIVNFNLLRENGEFFGYSEVFHFASLYNIHLRTGCFCNPGACQFFLGLSPEDVQRHFDAGHVCGDQNDLVNGQPTGSVRISFGYMSTKLDADKFLEMVQNCFVSQKKILTHSRSIKPNNCNAKGTLKKIILYPIKSCGGFAVDKWPITSTGLKFDRQWMLINSTGVCLTQKSHKNLCLIRPSIDLSGNLLILERCGFGAISISLDEFGSRYDVDLCQSKVCGDKIKGWDCGDEVSDWLSEIIGVSGIRLLRQSLECDSRISKKNASLPLSLSNYAQYLLINTKSVQWLREKIPKPEPNELVSTTIQRFRPNFVVDFQNEFVENDCKEFRFGDLRFVSGGSCTRCQMICIDQNTGQVSKEPLQTLSRVFKGKIAFGVYLNRMENEELWLYVGSIVTGR